MRHNIHQNESEREREYRMHEKIERGEKMTGDLAADMDMKGGAGEVRRERQAWADRRRMPDLSDEEE